MAYHFVREEDHFATVFWPVGCRMTHPRLLGVEDLVVLVRRPPCMDLPVRASVGVLILALLSSADHSRSPAVEQVEDPAA